MRVTVLGCGASGGVPLLGCDCAVCHSPDPRDRRRRSSVLVEQGATRLLIDASPDLRAQLLDAQVTRIDAVLFSHAHADHCHGIDDLRLICRAMDTAVPAYGDAETLAELARRFGYAFEAKTTSWFRPALEPRTVNGPFAVAGATVRPFPQNHGPTMVTLGFRIGPFAYSTDVSDLDDDAFAALEGVETWVVDCQSIEPSYVHSHLERALGWIERVRPRRAVLTHMGHDFAYAALANRLPEGVEPGYDGLELVMEDGR
ncbi:MAG: MBL fold metallo-hydrolase [Alphaproteobacteria bacterium]|nr:MBL fold metallo-hydrolase [Alphaproteobacteria bacterium]